MDESTSLQRTYRYLRIGIGSTILVIFVAVTVVSIDTHEILPSISQYFYSPARSLFVGALIAASIALFALSGRGPERSLLNAAAIFAPLIALVSTPIPGVEGCTFDGGCVPTDAEPDVDTGVTTYLIIGFLAIAAVVLAMLIAKVTIRTVWVSLIVGGAVLILVLLLRWLARDFFLSFAHVGAAGIFFLLIGAAAVFNVRDEDKDHPPSGPMRVIYWIVAIGMVIDVVAFIIVVLSAINSDTSGATLAEPLVPPVFLCEAIALSLFLLFWVVQSIQKWGHRDPSVQKSTARKRAAPKKA
jgi:hypothetical protein